MLEPTKQAVLDMKASLDKAQIVHQDQALRQAAGQAFYNTSRFTLRDLKARASQQQLKADFEAYLDGLSPNNGEAGEHWTPRDAVKLMANLIFLPIMGEVDRYSRGIVKDRNRLYWEDFKQIPSCYPPYPEQVAIADAVMEWSKDINEAVDRVQREISLVREYRTRLIADVATGKLDVREAAAQLPIEGDEPEQPEEVEATLDIEEEAAERMDEEPVEAEP